MIAQEGSELRQAVQPIDHAKLVATVAANPLDYGDLLEACIREWSSSTDAKIDGRRTPVLVAIELFRCGLASSKLEMLLFWKDDSVAAFAILSRTAGWLEGHLFYVLPKYRGHGILRDHFGFVMHLARQLDLSGFRVRSTAKAWASLPGFESTELLRQKDGTVVYDHRRAA